MNWWFSDFIATYLVLDKIKRVDVQGKLNDFLQFFPKINNESQLSVLRNTAEHQYSWLSSYYIDCVYSEVVQWEAMNECLKNARQQLIGFNEDVDFDLSKEFRCENAFVSLLFLKIFLRQKDRLDQRDPNRPMDFKESQQLVKNTLDVLTENLKKDKPKKKGNRHARLTNFVYIPYFHEYMRYKAIMNSCLFLAGGTSLALFVKAIKIHSMVDVFSRDYGSGWALLGIWLSIYGVMRSKENPDKRVNKFG
ncbi:MAG: hypothetical protein AAGI90_03415 [Chlamydiota bacterium]